MVTLLKHEIRRNIKALLIWALCAGVICFSCLLLFHSLEDTMEEMAGAYAQMGAFSAALGLDRLSVSTPEGFYATEIALIFAIGGAMFAAMTGAGIVAKEEEGHTSEFLHTLPFGRSRILLSKYAAMAILIFLFQAICLLWIAAGFAGIGTFPDKDTFFLYHSMQFLMQLEVGSICFVVSSVSRKRQIGMALGFSVLLYLADLLCRAIPGLKNIKYLTPFYFSNAADIFAGGSVDVEMASVSLAVTIVCVVCAAVIYDKRDLTA